MLNMDFNIINTLLVLGTIILLIFKVFKPLLVKRNEIKLMEVQNEKMNLMMKLDPEAAEKEIDKLIKGYINEYVINNFIINDVNYIRKDEIDLMVKNLDRVIMMELSELYIFYIKILRDISNETDILKYINKKVKEHVLDFVVEYNKEK